jgi:2-isopropylmalate synthase
VEGTLFGNGERTGNLDIINVAMNLYMHGIDPKLNFSNINQLISVYERCTGMTVPPRHPYAGELVFTAFSGSHQDAIKKGLAEWDRLRAICSTEPAHAIGKALEKRESDAGTNVLWRVPYLTIDPQDLGRQYREVIRVNSQSGKGGVAYLLESDYGISLPKDLQREFGPLANTLVDRLGREVTAAELRDMFWNEYVERVEPWKLESFEVEGRPGAINCTAQLGHATGSVVLKGTGNGPIAALVHALTAYLQRPLEITHYSEHSLGTGAAAQAIAYIQLNGVTFGAGVDTSIELASINAVLSALNRIKPERVGAP